jgi:predicted transcriptional regulator
MTLSVRLDEKTEEILEKAARALHTSKTEVVRRSIQEYCRKTLDDLEKKPYDLIKDLIGEESSGRGDLSVRGEEILRERFGRTR